MLRPIALVRPTPSHATPTPVTPRWGRRLTTIVPALTAAWLLGAGQASAQTTSKPRAGGSTPAAAARPAVVPGGQKCITELEVVQAQKAWGQGIIEIGKVFTQGGDVAAAAASHINKFYGYDLSLVLFKPTLASVDQFRTSFDAALSYFVGGNASFPEDKGFAIKPWSNVRWKNYGIVNNSCNMAVAMGNYWFTPAAGGPDTKVEYTFGYVRGEDGALRIVVHHSSVPYTPN